MTPLSGLSYPIAVDYGMELDRVFWTNVDDDSISQAFVAVSNIENSSTLLVQNGVHLDGLAWDWIGQNVFYTDTGLNRIGVVATVGLYHTLILAYGLDEPRAIALDPMAG